MKTLRRLLCLCGLLLLLLWPAARAEPYLAVGQGLKCSGCHVNPTGGGLRNAAGAAFAQYGLAAWPLPDAAWWNGQLGDRLRIGSDLRDSHSRTSVPNQPAQTQSGLDQWRLYGDLQIVRDWVGLYVDEWMRPGKRHGEEAYLRLSTPGMGWYAKAGQFYLPFGWRLQDSTSFVRSVSGIGMTTPDCGVELGLEQGDWSAQLVHSRGPGNVGGISGHQVTGQVVWLQPWGRIGGALASTTSSAGNRQVSGLFGGFVTGPLAWLGEVDLVRDAGYPEGTRMLLATLAEVNWRVARGWNLKLSGEFFDPDRHVANDHKVRQSLVLEFTPVAYGQLRAGLRRWHGIPQSDLDNRSLSFVELHLLF